MSDNKASLLWWTKQWVVIVELVKCVAVSLNDWSIILSMVTFLSFSRKLIQPSIKQILRVLLWRGCEDDDHLPVIQNVWSLDSVTPIQLHITQKYTVIPPYWQISSEQCTIMWFYLHKLYVASRHLTHERYYIINITKSVYAFRGWSRGHQLNYTTTTTTTTTSTIKQKLPQIT